MMKTLLRAFAVALALAPLLVPAADVPADRWHLADLYESQPAWHTDAATLQRQLKQIAACRGRLAESARRLARCLDLKADIERRHDRLSLYAGLLHHEDTALAAPKELDQRAERLGTQMREAAAFLRPELLSIGRDKLRRFVAAEPALRKHRYPIETALRAQRHTLDAKGEALLATLGQATNGGAEVYSMLVDADLPWPTVTLSDGRTVTVDQTGYERYRQLADREDRKRVMHAFFGRWKQYERSFGVTFYEMLKRDAAYAQVRRYPDSLARALDAEHLPRAVIDTLIAETRAHLPTLHRYFRLRAKLLKLDDLGYHDIYPALVQSELKFPFERSRQLMREALAPLGQAYGAALAEALHDGWMDVYPREHKHSGAYAASAWDVHPFMLLNHNDDYESLTTLAHEWGHAMHSHLANRAQPYVTAEYTTFTAEIASTLNESLLLDHMLKLARNDDEQLFYLGSGLETLRGTFFRQTMLAEFEREVHARADRGEPLSGETLSRLYGTILRRYHGQAEGVMTIDPAFDIEWAYIAHFYNGFYVFQYATSIAAAALFADDIVAGKPGARDRFLGLLAAGGSDDPYKLVKAAGVDLAAPAPYRAIVARMNRIMDEIEAIVARRPVR